MRLQEEPERVKVALTAYLEERHIPFSNGTSTKCATSATASSRALQTWHPGFCASARGYLAV